MRAAIIDFGHVDSIISLAKYLGKKINVDLYLTFAQGYKSTSIINFQDLKINNGLLSKEETKEILGEKIIKYFEGNVNCRVFIFNSLKLKDPLNYLLTKKFADHLKKNDYDIIHFNGNHLFETFLHHLLKKIPRVHTIHDAVPHSGEGSWKFQMRNKFLEKQKIEFILQSEFSVKQLLENYKFDQNKVHSIYYGSLEIYKYYSNCITEENITEKRILFFGRISPYKGIEYLIEAFKQARNKIPDLKLTIAGKGDFYFDFEDVKDYASLEIINRYIPNEELVKLIRKSSVIVCPYIDATQSGVVMTAFAFNKPVIASSVGGIVEVIESGITGKLVPPKDPDALSEAIINLFKTEGLLEKYSDNIKDISNSNKLSWYKIADQTLEVYKKAIKEQKKK